MTYTTRKLGLALLSGASMLAFTAMPASSEGLPPETSLSTLEYELVGRADLWTYKALDSYSEAPFLSELVAAGALPPVEERVPDEPLVFFTDAMSDGVGEYGGVFRHVIGGRPEGWNWMAGQHQGWGGINMIVQECFVRNGPLWQVKGEEQTGPLPNLAQSWSWSDDNTELTVNLIRGAHWSDGDAFDTEDVAFWWFDNVEDENVQSRLPKGGMGEGTTLEVVDEYTFKFNFAEPQGSGRIASLAYIQGCPGPSHVLKGHHPTYNSDKSYDDYLSALPADAVPPVVMGPYVPVVFRPDELVVLRRNPFYWKVDEAGNQLPYHNEMHFKLSKWSDRTVQAIAGTGDFSNMEHMGDFVEALERAEEPDAPTAVRFGARYQSFEVEMNLSETVTVENEVDAELRKLFRNKDFRVAITHALDRDAIGQSLARGPFAHPHAGGFSTGSPFFDNASTVYRTYQPDVSNELLDSLGLVDTDGDGIRNLPVTGGNVEIDFAFRGDEATHRRMSDAVISMVGDVGIRIVPNPVDGNTRALEDAGDFNWILRRNHWLNPPRQTCNYVPIAPNCPAWHLTDENGNRDLLDFELELIEATNDALEAVDDQVRIEATKRIQRLWTENVYTVGLIQTPGALLINKRIRNAHPGTPVFMFEWAEDGVVRERLWTPADLQIDELLEGEVPQYQ